MLISRVQRLMFGDEELVLRMPSSILESETTFVPVESKRRGYRIRIKGRRVVVTRYNRWRVIAGQLPLYRFVGRLAECRRTNGSVSIPGVITMSPLPKTFMSIWFAAVVLIIMFFLAWAMLLAGKVMLDSRSVPADDLATVGFMIGGGSIVLTGGVALLTFVRLLDKGQRRMLVEFCANAHAYIK